MNDEMEEAYSPEELAALGQEPEDAEDSAIQDEAEAEAEAPEAEADEPDGEDEEKGESESEEPDKAGKKVPLAALHEERRRRKDLDREVAELRQKVQILDTVQERFNRFEQRQTGNQEQPAAPPPDPKDDPFGYIEHLGAQVATMQQQTQAQQEQARQRQQYEEQQRQFLTIVSQDEAEFRQEAEDYDDAASFVRQSVHDELKLMGYPANMAQEQTRAALLNIALSAKESGRNVGEVVYSLAKARGWTAKPAVDASADTTIERVAKGQKVHRDVSAGSASGTGKMTLERFASLSEADAFKWMEKNPKAAEALFGN